MRLILIASMVLTNLPSLVTTAKAKDIEFNAESASSDIGKRINLNPTPSFHEHVQKSGQKFLAKKSIDAIYDAFYAQNVLETGHVGTITMGDVSFENPSAVLGSPDGAPVGIINNACPSFDILAYEIVDFGHTFQLDGTQEGGSVYMYTRKTDGGSTSSAITLEVSSDKQNWTYIGRLFSAAESTDWALIGHTYTGEVRYARLYVQRTTNSCFFENRIEFEVDYVQINGTPLPLLDRSVLSPSDCNVSACGDTQGEAGDPINSRTGNFSYNNIDLSTNTVVGPLTFERYYASQATEIYTTTNGISPGWTHNQDVRLIFEQGTVWFKAHTANQYKFFDNGNGTFTPYDGNLSSLDYDSGNDKYLLKTSNQLTYTFSPAGNLEKWRNALGYGFDYSYNNGLLDRVTEPVSGRYLQFSYSGGHLTSVSDGVRQPIYFSYDLSGNLETFIDTLGNSWTYSYTNPNFPSHLSEITDPLAKTVLTVEYDGTGRAINEFDGLDNNIVSLDYGGGRTTTITQINDGKTYTSTQTYDSRHTLVNRTDGLGSQSKEYDLSFRPTSVADRLGNQTIMEWSSDGKNLMQIINALDVPTVMTYDSLNNLTSIAVNGEYTTTYVYSGTLLMQSIDAEGKATSYTYTSAVDSPQPAGLVKTVEDPNSNLTTYTYNANGELVSLTDTLNRVTQYQYDSLGQQYRVIYPGGEKSDWTCYDDAGRVTRTVRNASWNGSGPDPCSLAYQPSGEVDQDRISETRYDPGGNAIAQIDWLISGAQVVTHTTRTYYDDANRPVSLVRNLSGQEIDAPQPPPTNLMTNDANIRSDTRYDVAGNAIASVEWVVEGSTLFTTTTRIYYDALGRPEYMVQNLSNWDWWNEDLPPEYLRTAEENLTTRTYYDANSNTIATEDPEGRITRTYYDALNRPYLSVENWQGADVYSPTPPVCNRNEGADENVCTETVYDANGNVIASVDPLGIITRSYYDANNRLVSVVQNLTGQSIEAENPPVYNPANPDQNVRTDTIYDDGGNTIATIDPAGTITRTYYDPLNRPYRVVHNLDPNDDVYSATPPACNRDESGLLDPYNVCSDTIYDPDTGQAIAAIDPLGRVTRTYYDALTRSYLVVRNLTAQSYEVTAPPSATQYGNDQNVAAQTVYDGAGNAIASIEWLVESGQVISHTTRTYYDALSRPITRLSGFDGDLFAATPPGYDPDDPDRNVRADTVYASDGSAIASVEWLADEIGQPLTRTARTYYDGLRRSVKVIRNLDPNWGYQNLTPPVCNRDAEGDDAPYNVCSETAYNVDGGVSVSTDALGYVTSYQYDDLGRTIQATNPLTHTTSYGYDVLGNRVTTTDAEGIVTRFEYNALGQLTAVIENYDPPRNPDSETNVRTEYTYDASGNRLAILDGKSHTTSFAYDALGRLQSESDALGHTWEYDYDVAGNRVQMTDANQATTLYTYDGLNRLAGIDYPAPDADVSYGYNALGLRTVMTDGLGLTSWEYDLLGRPLTITHPISGTVGYRYDAAGNRNRLLYPDGKVVSYGYDPLGRPEQVTDWNTQVVTYTYDVNGRLLGIFRPNGVSSSYQYDPAGDLLELRHVSGEEEIAAYVYQYDALGNRTQVSEHVRQLMSVSTAPPAAPDGLTAEQTGYQAVALTWEDQAEDESGFHLERSSDGQNWLEIADLEADTSRYVDEGLARHTDYWYRLSAWNEQGESDPVNLATGTGFDPLTYEASGGTVTPNATPWLSQTITYAYDDLYRLMQADYDDGGYFHYTYDAVGNRELQTTEAYTNTYQYDEANRLTVVDSITYTWDANGNLLSDGTKTYAYDHSNRLTSVNDGQSSYSYAYNGLGDRAQQTTNGVPANYALDIAAGLTQVLQDGTNAYLYGVDRLAQYEASGAQYFLGDALGSVRQLVDVEGNATLAKEYEPYGEVLGSAGDGTTNYGFTAEAMDETGLVYLRARYFSSTTARFISKDTWNGYYKNPISYNFWLYAYSNPIMFTDPTGFSPGSGMVYLGLCLDLSTLTNGMWYSLGPTTASDAVAICRKAFSKDNWTTPKSDSLPTTTAELMSWYIHEYGDTHLYFGGTQPLTKELSKSTLINDIRNWYYQGVDVSGPTLYEFNTFEAFSSFWFDLRNSFYTFNLPLSAFLGSFFYQVKTLPNNRIGYRIDNDTTIESGTHIGGRFPTAGFRGSVEELIDQRPDLANKPLYEIISDQQDFPLISILRSRTRTETRRTLGGGVMYQTFTWTEKHDECLVGLMPWEVYSFMLDIQPWHDFYAYTIPVFTSSNSKVSR